MKTMLLSDVPEALIPNGFQDRRHAVYCRADFSDLEDLVRHYLREEAEREAIDEIHRAKLKKEPWLYAEIACAALPESDTETGNQ